MAMLPVGIFASAALLLGLAVGGWAGWLSRGRRPAVHREAVGPGNSGIAEVSSLWDPHGCLNALNRCILNAAPPLAEDNQLYVVSDHLRLLGQLSQSGGWISPRRVQEWVEALVALQSDASTSGAYSVSLPENRIRQLQILPLGAALLPLLRQARPVACVSIEAGDMRLPSGAKQTASLVLHLRVSEGRKANAPHPEDATRASREWDVAVVCECTVIH